MKTFNIGLAGCGFMGKAHTFGYKTIPLYYENVPFKINLKTVCASSGKSAKAAAERLGYEKYTSDFYELVNDPEIDIIDICTPNNLHFEEIDAAMKAKKHIYCDKPLTAAYSEAQKIAVAEKNYKKCTQITFQNRFFPSTMLAKKMIDEGKIGKIISFEAKFLHSGSVDENKPIGWKQEEKNGGGVIADLGSHVIDLMRYLLGDYADVFCKTKILYPTRPDKNGNIVKITAEDEAHALFTMKNGANGTMTLSKIASGTNDELSFEIYGDKGALRYNLMDANYLYWFDNTQKEEALGGERGFKRIECVQRFDAPAGLFPSSKSSIGWLRGHVHCLYSFLDCVYKNKKCAPSFADGAYVNYIMEIMRKSAAEGKKLDC